MLDVGIVGTGAIGARVAGRLADGVVPDARLTAVHNRTPERAHDLVASLDVDHDVAVVPDAVAVSERADVVVETAGQDALAASAVPILDGGTDLVAMSVGAFRDADLLADVRETARANDARVRVPSGSIAGLDAAGALGNGPLDEVALHCYRPAHYYGPYLGDGEDPADLSDGDVVFEGPADEAAEAFPSHMNVAMTVALNARVDPGAVTIHIEVESSAPRARYVVHADGPNGTLEAEYLNARTDSEPETGHCNVFSIVESLRRLVDPVVVGT